MKKQFNLVKEKNSFQIICEEKSVKEIKKEDGSISVEIEGYASTKDRDRVDDIVNPEAFKEALELYMKNPVILLQHKHDKPIGKVTEALIDDNGLYIKALITENTDGVQSQLKNGVLRTFSIGYRVKEHETKENIDAEGNYDYVNVIKDLELYEISLVSVPANPYALLKSIEDCFEVKEVAEDEPNEDAEEKNEEEVVETEVEESNEEETPIEDDTTDNEDTELTGNVEIHKENENEEEKIEDTEKKDDETVVTTIPENEETEEKENDGANVSEEENNAADENSEIEDLGKTEEAENVVETPTDEDEKSLVAEQKDLNLHDDYSKEIKALEKSFTDRLSLSEKSIKDLQEENGQLKGLLKTCIEAMVKLDMAVRNTVVKNGVTYSQIAKKQSPYGAVIEAIKNL